MNGIMVVNKEKNMSSHDVVNKVRKILGTKKVGHLGTLDPLATGVLVLTINDGTKLAQFIENVDKTYIATILIGKSTDTYDSEGQINDCKEVPIIEQSVLENALKHFIGTSKQTPPIFSAIKKNGKKLYEYARKGEKVEIEPREITVKSIRMVTTPLFIDKTCQFSFEVTVSKGTYIRSLCFDIAKYLGYPGYMKDLIRIRSGNFSIDNASTIDDIEKGEYSFYSMLDSLKGEVILDDISLINKAKNGMKISKIEILNIVNNLPHQIVIKDKENLKAIYQLSEECYKAVRVWN